MEFSKVMCRYLRHCNVRFSTRFFRQRIQSHPDYPALIAFTDTLDEVDLPYTAVIADKEKYEELTYPLLAHITDNGQEEFLSVLTKNVFEKNNGTLLNQWNGIAVMIKPGTAIRYKEHTLRLNKEKAQNSGRALIVLLMIAVLTSASLYEFSIARLLLMITGITGIGICSLIIIYGMGKDNIITEKLCASDGVRGCDKILRSKAATLWRNISVGDAGLVYFCGISIFLALSSITPSAHDAFSLLLLPFALSLPFSLGSFWYQWRIAKSWCKMCLVVIALLWLQSLILFIANDFHFHVAVSLFTALLFAISFLIPAVSWAVIKPLLKKADAFVANETGILRWKRNPAVFFALLYRQRKVDVSSWEEDVILGNPDAPLQLMIACNPYCGPCAWAHGILEELLRKHPGNIGMTIRFNAAADNRGNKKDMAIMHILQAYHDTRKKETKISENPVADWFDWSDLDRFKEQYATHPDYNDYRYLLKKHMEWNRKSEITHTPTIFINGYELTGNYNVNDLNFLMHQIIEHITSLPVMAI